MSKNELSRINEIRFCSSISNYESSIIELYEAAFPIDERRPTSDLIELMNNRKTCGSIYKMTVLVDYEDNFLGFISAHIFDDFHYIEHFAIKEDLRGQGWGEASITQYHKMFGDKPLLLEAEPDDNGGMASRRLRFYKRCGFKIISKNYIQPPYDKRLCSIPLYLLSKDVPCIQSNLNVESVTKILHTNIYNV